MSEEEERDALIQRIIEILKEASTQEIRLVLIATHGMTKK